MKNPTAGGAAGLDKTSSLPGRIDDAPETAPAQAENDPSLITCESMRTDELRTCLIKEISRAKAVGRLAQEALLDNDDDVTLANLRWQWRVIRAGIAPLAAELAALRRARAAP